MKLVPVAVRVNAAPPALALAGDIAVIVGTALLIGNVQAVDVPPPGAGFVTVTIADPELLISLAGTWAVSCVELTKFVVSADPFQLITAPPTYPVPLTVSVKVAPPTVALTGETEVIVGTALPMANDVAPEVPPPGVVFVTVMLAVPLAAISLAGTWAVS